MTINLIMVTGLAYDKHDITIKIDKDNLAHDIILMPYGTRHHPLGSTLFSRLGRNTFLLDLTNV